MYELSVMVCDAQDGSALDQLSVNFGIRDLQMVSNPKSPLADRYVDYIAGKLRSLHQFIDRSPHILGVRVYSGKFSVENYTTISGNKYKLINLPFYLVYKLPEYLEFA